MILSLPLEKLLGSWYAANARDLPWRRDRDPYHVWISEIMLQQTRVEAVVGYYRRFLAALPDLHALAAADEDRLLKLWEGLGYYNRARNLQKAAKQIEALHGGVFPKTYDEIRALPGIGPYTAGAIGSICFGLPTPAVDGNVLRVISRLTELDRSIDQPAVKREVTAALEAHYTPQNSNLLTQGLMELGACVCVPNGAPQCERCPLCGFCGANKNGTWKKYPVRDEKKARRKERRTVLILRCGNRVAIRQRSARGLLAKLWEFPNEVDTAETDDDAALAHALRLAEETGAKPQMILQQRAYTHVFTHVEWDMRAFYFACRAMPDSFTWVTQDELRGEFALPSAFRPFAETIE